MPKVAIIVTKSEFGGGQEYIRILMSSSRNTEFILITGDRGFLTEAAEKMHVAVHVCKDLVHPIHPAHDLKAIAAVYRILRREKPHLLHANSSKAGIVGRVAAQLAGVPAVFTAHGWAFTEGVSARRAWLAKRIEKAIAPLARKIICVSDYDRGLALRNGVGNPAQLVTIHNGLPDIPPAAGEHLNPVPRAVMVARFAAPKDYAMLLRAVAHFSADQLQLQCVGDGPDLPQSRRLAEQLDLQDRVEFCGARSDVPELLRRADIFVLLSRWEGLPISVLEAMRAGLPVIASRVGGVPEAVDDGATGLLVERGDLGGVVQALRLLAARPELRRKMGQAGRERFLQRFSSRRMVSEIGAIYADVLGGAHRPDAASDFLPR